MKIHPEKSQYIVINSEDSLPFHLQDIQIKRTDKYLYLGTWISNASIADQVKNHLKAKANQTLKFSSFLAKNADAPYPVKRKVWESALLSSLFYSCESWLTSNLKMAEQVYASTLKQLLGVRTTTCTDLSIVEAGEKGAVSLVRERQRRFISRVRNRNDHDQSHLAKVMELAVRMRSPAGLLLRSIDGDDDDDHTERYAASVRDSSSSRRMAYKAMNPSLERSTVYTLIDLPEHHRIAFTRMRLSSHNLTFEKGRWSRTPPELRFCLCGEIQNDVHVLLSCPLINSVKRPIDFYPSNIDELFSGDPITVCRYIFLVLQIYQ